MKRVRDARKELAAEGILILGHQGSDPDMAVQYGFKPPRKGEFIAVDTST
jgi:hypothetical protein